MKFEIEDGIKTFIEEDKKGNMGVEWRYSKKKFKQDLKEYLIKRLVLHLGTRYERSQKMLLTQY